MNLLKLFLISQILSFKSGKISLRSKFSDKSLRNIPIEKRTQRERMQKIFEYCKGTCGRKFEALHL